MNAGFLVIGLLLAARVVAGAEVRSWTFEQSGKTIEGEVVGFSGESVTIKGAHGKSFTVPIAYLVESNRVVLVAERKRQWKEVEVVKLTGTELAGRYKKCAVRGAGVNGEIYVTLLPSAVEAILNKRNQQADQITNLTSRIAAEAQAVKQGKAVVAANASAKRAYRRAVAAERAQVDAEAKDVKNGQTNVAKLQKSYDDYVKQTKEQTMVKMRNTGAVYKGLAVWECFDPRKRQE